MSSASHLDKNCLLCLHISLLPRIENFTAGNVQFGFCFLFLSLLIPTVCRWKKGILHEQPERLQFNSNVVRFACFTLPFYWGETWIVWVCILGNAIAELWTEYFHHFVWFIIIAFPPLTEFLCHFVSKFAFPNRLDSIPMHKCRRLQGLVQFSVVFTVFGSEFWSRRIGRGSDATKIYIMIHSDWIIAHHHSWSPHIEMNSVQ